MNRDEAKNILRLYRPSGADAEDPQIAEALALAAQDSELARWLEDHAARQRAVRQKLRQIKAPAGLLEQIVSEQRARERAGFWRRQAMLLAAAAMVAVLIGLPFWLRPSLKPGVGFATYQTQMAAIALRDYAMDVTSNDAGQIRQYLAQHQAPADYVLPAGLQSAALAGCALENWQGKNISMICFRTGRPLVNGQQVDLWLFVIDQAALADPPAAGAPQFKQISRLATATWNANGKVYLLGTTAEATVLNQFL